MNLTLFLPLIVVWLVPWGFLNLSYTVPSQFGVGLVLPYCVDDGYVNPAWARWVVNASNYYYERGYVVFIQLFPFYRGWSWRGNYYSIGYSIPQSVIEVLRKCRFHAIGLSQLKSCCVDSLRAVLQHLRSEFPSKLIFYYGNWDEDIEHVLAVADLVDVIGIDIWCYCLAEWRPFNLPVIKLPAVVLNTLKTLKHYCVEHGKTLMIGEVGFRRDDLLGFVMPWDWRFRAVECEPADAHYYEQVIGEITELCGRDVIVGIWSWNDRAYAVGLEQDVQATLLKFLDAQRAPVPHPHPCLHPHRHIYPT